MANTIEAQGVTVDEAIQLALNQLGVGRDSVEIKILHHPRSGFLGIGARRAKVRATVREDALQDGAEFDMAEGRRNRRRRRPPRHRRGGEKAASSGSESGGASEQKTADNRRDSNKGGRDAGSEQRSGEGKPRGNRRGGRGRQGRGGRNEQAAGAPKQQAQGNEGGERNERGQSSQNGERERGRDSRRGRGRGRGRDQRREGRDDSAGSAPAEKADANAPDKQPRQPREDARPPRTPRSDPPAQQSEPKAPEPAVEALPLTEISSRAGEIVTDMLRLMGFDAKVLAVCDEESDEVIVQVQADAEGLLIGRRGQTLDALEHIVNRSVAAREAAENRVVIDVGGYRDRRRESLLELAERLRERAVSEGRRVQVSPMSPRDRKVFQDAFSEDKEITTRALGTGFYRRVLIVPEGADEREQGGEAEVVESSDTPQAGEQVE